MENRSMTGRTGVVFPTPYSQIPKRRRRRLPFDLGEEETTGLCPGTDDVHARVRVVHNGWVVVDSKGTEFYYTDPTDALYAVTVHLEMPPVNPLAVLWGDD